MPVRLCLQYGLQVYYKSLSTSNFRKSLGCLRCISETVFLQNADQFDLCGHDLTFFTCPVHMHKHTIYIPHTQLCRKCMTLHFLRNLEWILRSRYQSISFLVIPSRHHYSHSKTDFGLIPDLYSNETLV